MILIAATFYHSYAFLGVSTLTFWKRTFFDIQLKLLVGKDMNIVNYKSETWDPRVLNAMPYDHLNVK